MPHDPARVADTRAWLQKADNDLRAAEHDQTAHPPLLGDLTFHSQQTAEKAFKAFLTWHDRPFRKTHNLEELGEACLALDPSLKPVVDRAVVLTQYAWRFRYPGEPGEPTPAEAEEALAVAREVFQSVRPRLPGEVSG
jgi:HEPN domain-containing protein